MSRDESTRIEFLKVSGIQSIKSKILIFALLATILPSLTLGWLSYLGNSELLREKISQELSHATDQASGKLDLWLKERLYDLRVFSSSYIVSENLARVTDQRSTDVEILLALDHVKEYLRSVSDKFGVYEELILINPDGKPLVTSAGEIDRVHLPEQWVTLLEADPAMVSKIEFDPYVSASNILIAETINTSNGYPLGVLAAKISLDSIGSILRFQSMDGIDEIYLLDAKGRLLVSTIPLSKPLRLSKLSADLLSRFSGQPWKTNDYVGFRGKSVVGMAAPIVSMEWVMVAEMEKDVAYAEIHKLRRVTMVLVSGLMFCIGVFAYIFGHGLVRPVRRLSKEAAKVASGNLDVDIPVHGLSEVSYLTQVFNHMVANLRRGREEISAANHALRETNKELHKLSVTDGLTGLHNRKHIMELFESEIVRARRYQNPLSILMLDIDHFKMINDTHGHQAGDAVMCRLADALLKSVRECDHVGRYGGEEFLVVLPESNIEKGREAAERIRRSVEEILIAGNEDKISVTVSIGISEFPYNGEDAESILSKADDALYQAKDGGRNQVVISRQASSQKPNIVRMHPAEAARR